eukprot:CAMPEP_0118688690 /NCGR_PEP_ID=MMETSP0800-20121206/9062_1 /TAXON_ID=210618 ORGANISM="Striatella unipunctata, Strain CCMP2910" /NCGR_SAMPLE_ID=MMETSP0800 /ASSEMBLY_ACC=CAM_ASM_000638 /LENGTH=114 /DNA_ID=CAMNT_0006585981 /DNA_START=181 /DNA_END=525 /DNA_ORIENTATION=-
MGDNPSVSYGPPVTLDWDYEELPWTSVDYYEETRAPRRNNRQLLLNYYQRRNILMWCCGFSDSDIKRATKLVEKDKRLRALTQTFLPIFQIEELVYSGKNAVRKCACCCGRRSM